MVRMLEFGGRAGLEYNEGFARFHQDIPRRVTMYPLSHTRFNDS